MSVSRHLFIAAFAALALIATPAAEGDPQELYNWLCPADVTCDEQVAVADLIQLLAQWGPCDGCWEDLDRDGEVGVSDLLTLLSDWGPCYTSR